MRLRFVFAADLILSELNLLQLQSRPTPRYLGSSDTHQSISPQPGIDISNTCTYATAAAAGGIYLTGPFTQDEHAKRNGVLAAEASSTAFFFTGR